MINLESVSKKFGTGVFGLSNISFSVERGEFVFLVGPTGSGKTTIFRLLTRETLPTNGTIIVNTLNLIKLPKSKIPELRKKIGVVFQDLKLLTDRTVVENIILPLEVSGVGTKEALRKAEEVLDQVGVLAHKEKFPVQLSGGELQRVAIARALVLSPEILLADEPTGNLDEATSWEIVKLLSDINEKGTTVLMATHNADIVKKLNKRIIELNKGEMINDKNHQKVKVKDDEEKVVEKESEEKDEPKEEKKDDKKEEKDDNKSMTDDFEEALKEDKK